MNGPDNRSAHPNTELQVVVTLKAARDVAETIERMRSALRQTDLPAHRRHKLKDDLLEAAERLCNLLDLLSSWVQEVSASVRRPLQEGIAELRGKLLSTGVRLVGDRAQRLTDQANDIIEQRVEFSVGVSFRLSESVRVLYQTVDALGGIEAMPEEVQGRLTGLRPLITRVAAIEERLGMTREIGRR